MPKICALKQEKEERSRALLLALPQMRGNIVLRGNGESKHGTLNSIPFHIRPFLKMSPEIIFLELHSFQPVAYFRERVPFNMRKGECENGNVW